ncbi:hypothetical protein SAMN05421743_101356 [Thalassobacillus cyri]|uniref:Uncharacterized protein n=1 Tax=Thalassobacillus cyri TaxID=571932 RepID=A0A1H3W8A3_9BACI|nr:hypothetical protein [Thalassobacillus cyri]SDZ83307.1 hypothetical protein SAMN05421743_101356 [Thalassobacillus cyri]
MNVQKKQLIIKYKEVIPMFLNIIVGTMIPWIICIYFFTKEPRLVILLFPVGATIAFLINDLGQVFFWTVTPDYLNPSLSIVPYNIGYYPMLAIIFAYVLIKSRIRPVYLVFLFTLAASCMEYIGLVAGKVDYHSGWNILLTALTYPIGFILCILYIKLSYYYRLLA